MTSTKVSAILAAAYAVAVVAAVFALTSSGGVAAGQAASIPGPVPGTTATPSTPDAAESTHTQLYPLPPPAPPAPSAESTTPAISVVIPGASLREENVPQALCDLESRALLVYATVKCNDWTAADEQLAWFPNGAMNAKLAVPGRNAAKRDLDAAISTLHLAVTARNAVNAMEAANAITWGAITLKQDYRPAAPVGVQRLAYYGRELEIWSRAGNIWRLAETARGINRTWQIVRPEVVANRAGTEARRLDGVLSRFDKSVTPEDYAAAIPEYFDRVGDVRSVFTGQRPAGAVAAE